MTQFHHVHILATPTLTRDEIKQKYMRHSSEALFMVMLQQSRSLITSPKQGVVLGRLFTADTLLTRLQGLQG